jgi:uncharacterized protein (TIGR02145 family)
MNENINTFIKGDFMRGINWRRWGWTLLLTAALTAMSVGTATAQTGTLVDSRDGKKYKTVKIGERTWLSENLNYKTESGSWCYDDDNSNCNKYGRLYDWNTARAVCPKGWHLPSKNGWRELVTMAGSKTGAPKLKSKSGWDGSGNGTDDYGFSALPGGRRNADGGFRNIGKRGYWWTATGHGSGFAFSRYMYHVKEFVEEDFNFRNEGFSVRCVSDNTHISP